MRAVPHGGWLSSLLLLLSGVGEHPLPNLRVGDVGVPHARARAPALALSELYHTYVSVCPEGCVARILSRARSSLSSLVELSRLCSAGACWLVVGCVVLAAPVPHEGARRPRKT